jgi:hypothetical protein
LLSRLSLYLLLAFAVALAGSAVLVWHYGAQDFAVQLASGFTAALAAFVLALAWERDREANQLTESAERLTEQQVVEVSRRLRTVRDELQANLKSFGDVERDLGPYMAVHPQLHDAAWTASAPSLAELVADYELTADIARTYGRIEELRWRLRTRTQLALQGGLEGMTSALVSELIPETKKLLERIDTEIANPSVRFGAIVQRVGIQSSVAARATIETKVRADEED